MKEKHVKKHLLALALLAVLVPSLAFAQANLGENFSNVKNLRFTRSAPTVAAASMAYQDSVTILSFADSIRTDNINTDGWDWSFSNVGTTALPPKAIAQVVFYVPTNYNLIAGDDTLYYCVEPSFDGGQTYVSNTCGAGTGNGQTAAALGNIAIYSNGYPTAQPVASVAAGSHLGVKYVGWLIMDNDTAPTNALLSYQVWGLRDFRLKILGGSGGVPIGTLRGSVYPISTRAVR